MLINKVINAIRKRNIRELIVFIINFPLYIYDKYKENKFDKYYGTNTNQKLDLKDYSVDSPNIDHACWYEAITKTYFDKMINQLSVEFQNNIFIDLGSGKGKSLMLAANYPFKKIIGVEFSPELHEIAEKNIEMFSTKERVQTPIQLHCMDAELYDLPMENIVVFLYNPFQGKVMRSVVEKFEKFLSDHPHQLTILYRNPKCSEMFEKNNTLQIVKETSDYKIYSRPASAND